MKLLDKLFEQQTRQLAQRSSRRGMLKSPGRLAGGGGQPSPCCRWRGPPPPKPRPGRWKRAIAASCDYWRYCAIDGFLCSCCGGSENTCPPGTEMSPVTWIGTCRNPADGRNYVISYNDCCGKSSCGACLCQRDEGDRPPYRPDKTNDINWCLGTSSAAYHCSTAIVVGVAFEDK